MSSRIGRPPIPRKLKKVGAVTVTLTAKDFKRFRAAQAAAEMAYGTDYLRSIVLAELERVEEKLRLKKALKEKETT